MDKTARFSARMARFLLVSSILMVSLLMAGFLSLSVLSYMRIEQKRAEETIARVLGVLDHRINEVVLLAEDYAGGVQRVQTFPEGETIDFIARYDGQGALAQYIPNPRALEASDVPRFLAEGHAVRGRGEREVHGPIGFGNRAYIVSSVALPDSGRLVAGKAIGQDLEQELGALAGAAVSLSILAPGAAEPARFVSEGIGRPALLNAAIPDLGGTPYLAVQTPMDRSVVFHGYRSIGIFILVSAIITGIGIFIFLRMSKTLITEPMHRLERIMQDTSEGIVITDLQSRILETNPAFCKISGYSQEELIGKNPSLLQSGKHPPEFYTGMWESIVGTGRWEGEIWDRRKDGSIYPKWLTIDTIYGTEGKKERYIAFSVDITRIKETENQLNRLAFYDSLTGLPNRALFQDRFTSALGRAQRNKTRVALLYLDLDHFKNVNDGYGHLTGDEILKGTCTRITAQVRDTDTVCRLGGDEFTVILESIHSSDDAARIARKIILALEQPFFLGPEEIYVGTSIGIALHPYDGQTVEELVKVADAAMYEAKEQGRGQFRFASGEAGKSSKKRVEVETMLRNAMSSDNLLLYYQPQVSAGSASSRSNRGLVGAEALIRLRNASGSIIGPDAFIDVAEETGLIVPIGEWALLTACAEAKRWLDMGKAIPVAVNVSQRQFEHSRIIEQTARALKESGLPPHLLKLEVTESLFMKDSDRAAAIMGELKAMGVTFAVDDFGTGYSSLRYIDTLPIDCLKIDKSFIQRIGAEDNDSAVALAVVSLARSFGLESIAEGVETEDQLSALRARGCDTIQGYFISKPLESSVFRSFLAENAHTAVPPVSGETGRGETPEPAPIEEELEELEEIL